MRTALAMSISVLLFGFGAQMSLAKECEDADTLARLTNDLACKQLVPCIQGGTAILTSANVDDSAKKLRDFADKLVVKSPYIRQTTTRLILRFVIDHQIEAYRILPTAFRLEKPRTVTGEASEDVKDECEITFVPDVAKMTVIMRYLNLATAMKASLDSSTREGIALARSINAGNVGQVQRRIDELIADANETAKRFTPFQLHYSVTVSGGEKSIVADDIGDHYLQSH